MSIESVAKALKCKGLKPTEKLVLIGVANHDGDGGAFPKVATLAGYACVSDRQVQKHLATLEDKGLLRRHYGQGRLVNTPDHEQSTLYELFLDGVNSTTPPGVNSTTPQEPSVEPSSSSRSSEAKTPDRVNDIVTRYYDDHQRLKSIPPSANWNVLRAVVRKVLKTIDDDDEIVAAMLGTRVMTGEALIEQIVKTRKAAGEQVVTGAIDPTAMRLFREWETWADVEHGPVGLLQDLSSMMKWDISRGEVAARLGGYARVHGPNGVPTLDDLREVPVGTWPGDGNYTVSEIFLRYANAERRLSR